MYEVRYLKENEKNFFLEILYESIYIEEERKPSIEVLLYTNEFIKYHQDLGRKGDTVLVATDDQLGTPIGAVWYRLFSSEKRGYGYVDDYTPELGIALKKEARGKGLGNKLMRAIMEEAKNNNFRRLSLSVDIDNTNAINLYRRLGFVEVGGEGKSITMLSG
ncbi:GNAT family N-acetyltransferase [Psychrobacillus sp. NPDC093180]|uniref:GNAT family N-acetyltransferase n=1 Tax=Psychrobacillus sp. NPDC093180 TaxID=3364489 RepID=UPI0038232DAB